MPFDSLLDCLRSELNTVDAFIVLLEDETKALLERSPPQVLSSITARKADLSEELEGLGSTRNTILRAMGYDAGHDGTVRAARQTPQLAPLWQQLLQRTEHARELNERNGLLIRTHLQFTNQALNALRNANGGDLYLRDGKRASVNLSLGRQA